MLPLLNELLFHSTQKVAMAPSVLWLLHELKSCCLVAVLIPQDQILRKNISEINKIMTDALGARYYPTFLCPGCFILGRGCEIFTGLEPQRALIIQHHLSLLPAEPLSHL